MQVEQKLLSEKVDRIHPVSVCVGSGPVRSKLPGKQEGIQRTLGEPSDHDSNVTLSEGQREGRKRGRVEMS